MLLTVKAGLFLLGLLALNVHALTITNVSHMPGCTKSDKNEFVSIRFALDEPANVKLKMFDGRDQLIKILNHSATEKGDQTVKWQCDDQLNRAVPEGHYHYTLSASANGKTVAHDVTDLTAGKIQSLTTLKWNRKNNNLSYSLQRNALVNIRVGIDNGGPLLRTLANWYPRAAGQYTLDWNGYDSENLVDLTKLNNINVTAIAFSLSDNTIVVGRSQTKPQYIKDISWKAQTRQAKNIKYAGRLRLGSSNLSDKLDYQVNIELPGAKKLKDNIYLISDEIQVLRISLPVEQRQQLSNQRFEPVLFVDGQYQFEMEVGFLPVTLKLDTRKYAPGEHYIAVNLRGFDGENGTVIRKINIEKK